MARPWCICKWSSRHAYSKIKDNEATFQKAPAALPPAPGQATTLNQLGISSILEFIEVTIVHLKA